MTGSVPAHHAVVHDDIEAGRASSLSRHFVDHAVLQPHRTGLDRDGLVHERPYEFGASKDIDDIDWLGHVA